jgi:hypothetical protein
VLAAGHAVVCVVEIYEQNSEPLMELLESGVIEVALLRPQTGLPPKLRPVLSVKEKLMLYYHREHPDFSPAMESIPSEASHD